MPRKIHRQPRRAMQHCTTVQDVLKEIEREQCDEMVVRSAFPNGYSHGGVDEDPIIDHPDPEDEYDPALS